VEILLDGIGGGHFWWFDQEGLAMRLKIREMVSGIDIVVDKAINPGS